MDTPDRTIASAPRHAQATSPCRGTNLLHALCHLRFLVLEGPRIGVISPVGAVLVQDRLARAIVLEEHSCGGIRLGCGRSGRVLGRGGRAVVTPGTALGASPTRLALSLLPTTSGFALRASRVAELYAHVERQGRGAGVGLTWSQLLPLPASHCAMHHSVGARSQDSDAVSVTVSVAPSGPWAP